MGVKILLADDSPTILKVVKIILAKEPFEIVECSREAELIPKLLEHTPTMVFLDFNFSETRTGYDLCREIKSQHPDCKILMMYATFDTVEENTLRESGADQHVVKPFDSNRFIFQVRGMAETEKPPAENWSTSESAAVTATPLEDELSDWAMAVPGVIGESGGSPEIPPVIDSKPTLPEEPLIVKEKITEVVTLPDEEDLAYPDITSDSPAPKSKLVSINELSLDFDTEDQPSSLDLMASSGMDEDAKRIEEQIRDEVEADLWKVDDFEEVSPRLAVVSEERDDLANDLEFSTSNPREIFDEKMFERLDESDRLALPATDLESLKPLIKQMVEEAVREYCRQQVDKVAWEVIPDLAENLIKKELQQISSKVTRDT